MKKSTRRPIRNSLNFTLIELLVVIAIIAILSAMLLPALNKAKDVARRGMCINQMRQITMAFIAYSDDFSSFGPISGILDSNGRSQPYYAGVMHRSGHLRVPKVYICPTAAGYRNAEQCLKALRPEVDLFSDTGRLLFNYIHYAANDYLVSLNPLWGGKPRRFDSFAAPSQKILLAESDSASPPTYATTERQGSGKGIFATSTLTGLVPMIDSRHLGSANIVWGDGHVSSEKNASPRLQQTIKQYRWDPLISNPSK